MIVQVSGYQTFQENDYFLNTFPQHKRNQGSNRLEAALEAEKGRAFVMVDMQEKFLQNIEHDECNALIISQIKVLSYCSMFDLPVLVFEDARSDSPYLNPFTMPPLDEFVKEVPRRKVLNKHGNNGFGNPEAKQILEEWGAREIYLMGVFASYCVLETAQGGLDNSFRIATAERLIADSYLDPDLEKIKLKSRLWYEQQGKIFAG